MLELLNFTPGEHGSTFIIDDIIFMSVKNLIKTSIKKCMSSCVIVFSILKLRDSIRRNMSQRLRIIALGFLLIYMTDVYTARKCIKLDDSLAVICKHQLNHDFYCPSSQERQWCHVLLTKLSIDHLCINPIHRIGLILK